MDYLNKLARKFKLFSDKVFYRSKIQTDILLLDLMFEKSARKFKSVFIAESQIFLAQTARKFKLALHAQIQRFRNFTKERENSNFFSDLFSNPTS